MAVSFDSERESKRLDAEKPYIELIDGVEVPKMSPMLRHSLLQSEMLRLVSAWACDRGIVGPELRVWLSKNPERPTSLVPDVAYIPLERLAGLSVEDEQRPPFAPDLTIEIRSPDDRERNVARKVELYLAYGARLVLDVNAGRRTIVAHAEDAVRTYVAGETFEHDAMPGLRFSVDDYFAAGEVRRQ